MKCYIFHSYMSYMYIIFDVAQLCDTHDKQNNIFAVTLLLKTVVTTLH